MAVPGIEHRVAVLESGVARLKKQLEKVVPSQGDWLDAFSGVFDNDPVYEEAMRLGRDGVAPPQASFQTVQTRPTCQSEETVICSEAFEMGDQDYGCSAN